MTSAPVLILDKHSGDDMGTKSTRGSDGVFETLCMFNHSSQLWYTATSMHWNNLQCNRWDTCAFLLTGEDHSLLLLQHAACSVLSVSTLPPVNLFFSLCEKINVWHWGRVNSANCVSSVFSLQETPHLCFTASIYVTSPTAQDKF